MGYRLAVDKDGGVVAAARIVEGTPLGSPGEGLSWLEKVYDELPPIPPDVAAEIEKGRTSVIVAPVAALKLDGESIVCLTKNQIIDRTAR